ncbi:MAG: hypothetical protein ACRDVE_20505, partial [Actinocrinis sp.]
LSLAGHAWMSGHGVAPWAIPVAATAVFAGAYLFAGRRRGLASIAGLMLLGQAALHELFGLSQASDAAGAWVDRIERVSAAVGALLHPQPTADSMAAQMAHMSMPMPPGMVMPGMPDTGTSAAATAMPGMSHGPWGMIAAHLVAGLLCSWWLARGEARVFGLLRGLLVWAFRPMPAICAWTLGPWRAPGTGIEPSPRRLRFAAVLVHSVVRRGPPPTAVAGI